MAGQADGSIIIDTELSSDGFKAGSAELLAAIKSLSEEVKSLGATLKEIFNKPLTPTIDTSSAEDNVDALDAKVRELESSIEELQNARTTEEPATPQMNLGSTTQKASNLQKQIEAVNTSVEHLEPTFQKAMSGSESAMTSFEGKASALEDKIAELQEKLDAVGQTQYPTQEYEELTAQVSKAEQALFRLYDKQDKMSATGVKETSRQWQSLQYDIQNAEEALKRLDAAKARMETSGTAFQMGVDTSQFAQMEDTLARAQARLEEMREGTRQSEGSMSRLALAARNVASFIGRAAKLAVGALVHGIKSAASHMAKMLTHSKAMNNQFGSLISGAKKFALSLLGARGIYALLRKAVSAYMAENQRLSSTLSACWSGIGNLLGPIITNLINLVAQAVAYVTSFLKLFGVFGSNAQKAISSAGGAASKETKELKRQLASFDELNILSDNSSDSGGGSSSETAATLPDVTLPDWAKLMVDQLKAGDWAAAATNLSEQLNSMIASVDWAGIGNKIGYYLNGALTFLATFIKTFDWMGLGANLATCVNNILNSVDWGNLGTVLVAQFAILLQLLSNFFETFNGKAFGDGLYDLLLGMITACDWAGLTGQLSQNISNFIQTIDFGKLGTALSTGMRTILQILNAAIVNFDWRRMGAKIAEFLNSIDWVGIISDLATLVSNALKGALNLFVGFAEKLDWAKLGHDLFNSLKSVVQNTDWGSIISLAVELLGAAIGGLAALVWGLIEGAWNDIIAWWNNTARDDGGNIIEGLLLGIWDAIKNIGTWIYEHIFQPFWEGIKEAFGIASPSTKMMEIGDFIVQGLLQGITGTWHAIVEFFSRAVSGIAGAISTAWSSVKKWTSETWSSIKTFISTAWTGVKSTTASVCSTIASKVSEAYSNVKSSISDKLSSAKDTASSAWESMSSTASSVGSSIASKVSETYADVKSYVAEKLTSAKESASSIWDSINSTAFSVSAAIASKVSGAYSNVKSYITDKLTSAKESASNIWGSMKSTVSSVGSSIAASASSAFAQMKSSITEKVNSAKANATTGWNSMKTAIASAATNMGSTVSSKFSGIYSTITSKISSAASTIKTGFESARSSIVSKMASAANTINNQGWRTIGSNICVGIGNGINSSWDWLSRTVRNVASNLLRAAKNALGIHSPSRLFRDEVGQYIGLGIGEGVEESEPSIIKSVSGVADAIADEFAANSYTISPINVDSNGTIPRALDSFSDKITDSFASMLDKLQAIADRVTFAMPSVASGAVPYSLKSADTANGGQLGSVIEASNNELGSVVIQSVTNATAAIVQAIQEHSGTTVTFDIDSITQGVISEINRKTRMTGNNPLLV